MGLLGIKLWLGLFPKTEKIENQYDALYKEYQDFLVYSDSEELKRFEYLNKYLSSEEFEEKENGGDTTQTDVENLKSELAGLKKSPKLIWYFKEKAQEAKFEPFKTWKLEFEDHFNDKLDNNKWLTRYYWGDKLLKDSYSLVGDRHFMTNGKNVSVSNTALSIETRKESAKGMAWSPTLGFIPQEFQYTSGTVNTGKSFRHEYGKVEAKVKVPKGDGNVFHAFWLAGDRILPQINVFKYTGKKFYLGNFWGDITDINGIKKDNTVISGAFAGKYYIFSLEWTPNQLTWSINGVVFKTMHRGIPTEPMYLAFGSGVEADASDFSQSQRLDVDWIRFFSKI